MTERTQHNLILIVEDSNEDYFVTTRAFKKAGMNNSIVRAKDGVEAIEYLENKEVALPSVVLLDLNLPKKNGREVLSYIRSRKHLLKIPVIVLTTSSDKRDISACYEMGANSYIQKPVDMHGFIEAIKMLKNYWFEIVILPNEENR
jgi:CheY-like chemotaxis protein